MTSQFQLNKLFNQEEITNLVQTFGFKRMSHEEIDIALQNAFFDYILAALTEDSASADENKKSL